MSSHKKKYITLGVVIAIGTFLIIKDIKKSASNSVESNKSPHHTPEHSPSHTPSQRIPAKELKKTASKIQLIKQQAHDHKNDEQENSIIDPNNHISTHVKAQLSKQLSKSLGSLATWKLSYVGTSQQGHKMLVELHDKQENKHSSYHALVEPKSGRILTTWHRQIHR